MLHSIRGNTSPPHHLTTPRLTHGAEGHSNNFLTWTFLRNFYTTPRHTPPNGHRIWVSLECFKTVDKYGGPLIFPLSDNRYLYDAYFLSLLECKVSANRLGSPGWISHAYSCQRDFEKFRNARKRLLTSAFSLKLSLSYDLCGQAYQ